MRIVQEICKKDSQAYKIFSTFCGTKWLSGLTFCISILDSQKAKINIKASKCFMFSLRGGSKLRDHFLYHEFRQFDDWQRRFGRRYISEGWIC